MNAAAHARPPALALPPLACDCHVHVFAPRRFGYALPRSYTPGEAEVGDLQAFLATLGLQRVVLVQPSAYGSDNRCLLDALVRLSSQPGPRQACGVAVVDPEATTPADLQALHAAGVRALRLNLEVRGEHDTTAAANAKVELRRLGSLLADSGMALQLHAPAALISALADDLATLGVPVLLDHFAGLRAALGETQPGLAAVADLLRGAPVFVKLSAPYRSSSQGPAHADLAWLARRLIAQAPQRLLWGSDWPHTGSSASRSGDLTQVEPFRPVDAGQALDRLADWAPDAALRRQILVDTPAEVFGFSAPSIA